MQRTSRIGEADMGSGLFMARQVGHEHGLCCACRELIKVMQGTSKEGGADMLRAWERQIDSETGTLEEAVERYKKAVADMKKRGEFAELAPARRMMLQWFEPLRDAIAREQRAVRLIQLRSLASSSLLTGRRSDMMHACPTPSCKLCYAQPLK